MITLLSVCSVLAVPLQCQCRTKRRTYVYVELFTVFRIRFRVMAGSIQQLYKVKIWNRHRMPWARVMHNSEISNPIRVGSCNSRLFDLPPLWDRRKYLCQKLICSESCVWVDTREHLNIVQRLVALASNLLLGKIKRFAM